MKVQRVVAATKGRQDEQGTMETRGVTEVELIARILAGETELFHELIRPYERMVYMTVFSVVKNEAEAEDGAQEAMISAYRHLASFRGDAKFSTWLVTIAINEGRKRLRKAKSAAEESIDEPTEGEEGEFTPALLTDWREIPSETLERNEVRQKLAEALAELGQIYREVFVLRDMQHLSIEETAKALGISSASVKTRLLRARLMLRDLLAPGLGAPWMSRMSFGKGTKPW